MMNRLMGLAVVGLLYGAAPAPALQPNFVVILIDDMGYGDIGPFRSTQNQTPQLDRMAEEGMRLTSFYVPAPVCTSSRAGLMTGCYPKRVGLAKGSWGVVLFPKDPNGLNPDELTIAEVLKDAGYATGCFGKWHLGDQPDFLPTRHGFDTGLAPEVTDLNAADVSYAKEQELADLPRPYMSTSPTDMDDGIPVGELGVDGGNAELVLAFADELARYTDDQHLTDSLLISYKGKLVFESYYRRGRRNYPHYQMSITKSYTALALGRAIQLGHFAMDDLHKPVVGFLKDVDPSKMAEGADRITLDNAMHMESGIRLDAQKVKELMKDPSRLKGQGQVQAYLEHTAPIPEKDIEFKYQASDPALAMQVVEAVVPGSAEEFIRTELLGKMGITNYGWQADLTGLPKSAAGCSMRSRDMLKIGMMVMAGGKWNGEQLIPEAFVKRAISPLAHSYGTSYYGYFWWVDDFEVGDKTYHCPAGRGAGGQFILMFPELELIVVITAHNRGMGTMLHDAPQRIIPAFVEKDEWSTFPLYSSVSYGQPLRPQFHFTSRMNWLNDPNGMVYYDGEWHMYFQHVAVANNRGPKSWGSAVSTDLMHWRQLPHAINPYPNVFGKEGIHAIWSGSAVVDVLNALGRQKGDVKTLYAIYTATDPDGFFQGAAYSTDKGRTWTKINDGKPVIPHQEGYSKGQRDPRVFYYAPGKYYVVIMMVGGKDHAVRLWKTTDLMHWEIMGDIPDKAAECIDMYTVAVDGNRDNMKWVIADAGTRYEIGDFDGKEWKGSGEGGHFDYGDCYYAAQVFNQGPEGRVVHIGWLRSKRRGYRPFLDAGMPFTQQLSIPAEITLRTTPDGIRMFRNPVREIEALYVRSHRLVNVTAKQANAKLASVSPELIDMTVVFRPGVDLTLNVRGLPIHYDDTKKEIQFTNTARVAGERAGMLTLPKAKQRPYRDTGLRAIPAPAVNGKVKLRVLVDRASLELFANDGAAAASFVVVPDPANRRIAMEGDEKLTFDAIEVNELKSVWCE